MKISGGLRRLTVPVSLGGVCAGFVAGVALQLQQAALWPAAVYALMLLLALILAAMVWIGLPGRSGPHVPPWRVRLAALGVAALLGFGVTGWRSEAFLADRLNPALEGRDITVIGTVLAMPQLSEDALRFRLGLESASLNGQAVKLPPQIMLGWYLAFAGREGRHAALQGDGFEQALALQRQPQPLRAGERWQMTVRLKAPHGNSNPHGFDYELWLWEQGIQATGYVRAGPNDAPPLRLSSSWYHPVERARQAVREAIYGRISNRQLAGVLAALVVGDQNAIERSDWDVFRATGVAHLMSISGLHITMFAWIASRLLASLWRRSARFTPRWCLALPASTAGALGGLLLAALYALFSGWGVPAQRTIWMLATVVLLRQSGRQWPWPQIWLLAMAVVVTFDPWALMQAGFWLSFVAVGVLFATGPPASSKSSEPDAAARHGDMFAINSVAGSARQQSVTGLFDSKNLTALALFFRRVGMAHVPQSQWPQTGDTWAVPTLQGKHTGFTSFVRLWLARPLAGLRSSAREQWVVTLALTPLSLLLFNQVSLVGLLANAVAIPWVTLLVTPLAMLGVLWAPLWDGAAWAVALLVLFLQWLASWPMASVSVAAAPLWCALAGVLGGCLLALKLPLHWRVLGVPLLLPVLWWQPAPVATGQFELLAADIGQGNAVLVRTATHSLLYDAGPRFSRESDAGNRVLVPLLRALGERLDLLVLSHRDSDHIGGAPAVLAMQPQAGLLSSIESGHALQALRPPNLSTRCVAGQRWDWDGVTFEVLHPAAADYEQATKSNAMSCVLRISNGRQTALLAGDIEAAQEAQLVGDAAQSLRAEVLLAPHHGSKTSSSAVFLDAVQPQVALVQAGYRNRFGHPVASVVARYEERGIRLLRSAQCGAARWQSASPAEVACQRQTGQRYWQHVAEP